MESIIFTNISLTELEQLIENSVRKVFSEQNGMEQPEFSEQLTIDLAVLLSVKNATPLKKSHIYKLTMESAMGKSDFPFKKFGRRIVIPRDKFIEWLDKNTFPSISSMDKATMQLAYTVKKHAKKPQL